MLKAFALLKALWACFKIYLASLISDGTFGGQIFGALFSRIYLLVIVAASLRTLLVTLIRIDTVDGEFGMDQLSLNTERYDERAAW